MGDEGGLDPCECIWNHELAMRRLLSLLRQGQAYCTDSECLEELPGLGGGTGASNNFMLMGLFMAFAMIMFVMRPRSSPQQSLEQKSFFSSQGHSGLPPPPPPPASPSN